MNIEKKQSPNYTQGRNGYKPDIIVCHITEGAFDGAVSWLTNKQSEASAHFVVSKTGKVIQLVNLEDTAWCNGTSTVASDSRYYGKSYIAAVRNRKTNANYCTISIEFEGYSATDKGALPAAQQTAAIELIKHIKSEVKRIYGTDIPFDREHIVGHCDIAPQWKPNCPGANFPYKAILDTLTTKPVDTTKVLFNGIEVEVERVFKDDTNYIKLRDLEKFGLKIGYDADKKLPIVEGCK